MEVGGRGGGPKLEMPESRYDDGLWQRILDDDGKRCGDIFPTRTRSRPRPLDENGASREQIKSRGEAGERQITHCELGAGRYAVVFVKRSPIPILPLQLGRAPKQDVGCAVARFVAGGDTWNKAVI